MKRFGALRHIVISFIGLLVIWQVVYQMGNVNQALFPSPADVWKALLELAESGRIVKDIGASMYRFGIGYLTAVFAAVMLGLLLGWFRKVFAYINPVIQLLRPVSPMAWMPFIVLWFGIGNIPAIVIIFIAAFFPVLLSTASAVAGVDRIYLKVSENFGIRQPAVLTRVVLPAAFPQIANGLHLALGTAWIFLVAGEMAGAQSGLGYLITDSRNNLRVDRLMAAILIIGVTGLLLDSLIGCIEKRILWRWGYAPDERGKN